MTAEVAILNRSAVALAADSVVTLIGPKGAKTFDTAEKIFELLRHQPVGLMIYNNPIFMNVPLEIIVRKFREENSGLKITGLVQVWPHFRAYLLDMKRDLDDEHGHLQALVAAEVGELSLERMTWLLEEGGRKRRRGSAKLDSHLLKHIEARKKLAESAPLEGFLEGKTFEEFKREYGAVISEALPTALRDYAIKPDLEEAIQRTLFALIRSSIRTNAYTGLVFAGFGEDELFASLQNIELDGIYFDEMRILKDEIVDIDRPTRVTAAVVPFAHTQMPQRFIYGIDTQFEAQLDDTMHSLTDQMLDLLNLELPRGIVRKARDLAVANFREAINEFKSRAMTEMKHVVDHLSKKELAEVAHSLVEMSWLKRRYSHDTESVGGPIDVAILTKNEGFIWVRRKHYFESSLNPGYTNRLNSGART